MSTIRSRGTPVPFDIHQDELQGSGSMDEDDNGMDKERDEVDEDDFQEDGYSDVSDETDIVVDPAVQEDMDRFQETFKGIKDRFRLINRIGEGRVNVLLCCELSFNMIHRNILYCVQGRGPFI